MHTYDYRNRMVGSARDENGTAGMYRDDSIGRRIEKRTVESSVQEVAYVHWGSRLVEEIRASDLKGVVYVSGIYRDEKLELRSNDEIIYPLIDSSYSVVLMASEQWR